MSFRKNREKESDVKVSVAKDSQGAAKQSAAEQSSQQQHAEQTSGQTPTGQQSGQESGQPEGQTSGGETTDETSDEQSDDKEDDSSGSEPIKVPDGTTAEILKWVGGDKDRAQAALDKESNADKPRSGLTGELEEILGT